MSRKTRVVLDSNVVFRMFFNKKPTGVAAALLSFLYADEFQLVTAEDLLEELRATFLHPEIMANTRRQPEEIDALIDALREKAVLTPGTATVTSPALAKRDPSDLKFLRTAVEGEADFLVTQDQDLLALGAFHTCKIVDPLELCRVIRAKNDWKQGQ